MPTDLFKLNNGWLLNTVAVRVDKLTAHSSCLSEFPNLEMWDKSELAKVFRLVGYLAFLFIIFHPTLVQEKLVKMDHSNTFNVSSIVGLVALVLTMVRVMEW